MTTLNRISDGVKDTLDVLAEGWQDLWSKARSAITRFTPETKVAKSPGNNRWGLLSAELHEGPETISIELEAPGLKKDDFEIFVNRLSLVVRGRKQSSSERTEGHYHITERAYGRFEREFLLPVEVDEAGTRASYKHGVLKIELPKSKSARPRIISIN